MAGKRSVPVRPLPSYHQLTFRQGPIPSARFMADGQTVVYSAAWNGGLTEVYSTQVATPGSRPLAIPDAEILSVSPMGELAVLLNSRFTMGWMRNGILARLAPSGGTPRQVAENVMHATWDAEGKELALVREVQGRYRLEYPIGRVIYETNGWIDSLRFSPTEPWSLAFIHHPMRGDSRGEIVVVSLEGTASVLTQEFSSAAGLAWTPGGREIWFSATETSGTKAIYAVSLNSRLRLVDQAPADMHLHDISLSGEVLLSRDSQRRGIFARAADADAETELSFLDWSRPGDLSRDGRWLLFEEQGQGGTSAYTVLLRDTEGKPPVTLGRGVSCSLSPDARWALTVSIQEPRRFTLMPTGAGEARHLNLGDLNIFHGAIHPDGKRLVVEGAKPGEASRLWIWTLDTEELHPLSPPGATFPYLIPETGEYVLATGSDGAPWIYPVDSGAPFPAPGTTAEDTPVGVSDDGTSIYVALRGTVPRTVERVELESGSRHEHLVLAPRDRTGLLGVDFIQMAADGQAYAYSFRRRLSTLYVVRGLLEGPGR